MQVTIFCGKLRQKQRTEKDQKKRRLYCCVGDPCCTFKESSSRRHLSYRRYWKRADGKPVWKKSYRSRKQDQSNFEKLLTLHSSIYVIYSRTEKRHKA